MSGRRRIPGGTRTHTGGGQTNELVTNALETTASRMREAGFEVGDGVEAVVDPRLPIMGYTIPGEGGRFRIVVSGGAVESGMLEGLLAHEISHIVRMRTKHPSHNPRIIEEAIRRVGDGTDMTDYQRKIFHDLVNNVEDLYADDIAFEVIRKAGLMTAEEATEFLQNWVEDEPSESRDRTRARWETAWHLANNARAIAQMARHGIVDTDGEAAAANDRLLSRLGPAARGHFEYLRELLGTMDEEITEDGYRKLLIDYLGRFLEIAEPA